jgi:hypothetical protein
MILPSQLKEGQCVRLVDSGGCIEFHRYYGELATIAKNGNSIPMDRSGIEITTDEELADKIFTSWYERIENAKIGKDPQACPTLKIEYSFGSPSFSLYLRPGNASKDSIRNLLEALSDLHIAAGGNGLEFRSASNIQWIGQILNMG